MAYKALYRTYRPKKFEEFAGQKHILVTIQNAVKENKLAHAYLFTGPRGTGKTSMAKLFSKTINCESSSDKPCNVCSNCISANKGNHPDIIEIDAASNNGVDEVRNLIEKVKYSPIQGAYKVYIIDEVHMMSTGAFNALLKTLEEPPSHVIFILATTEPHKVLPTIVSRCQRFDFGKITSEDIKKKIVDVLNQENISFENELVDLVCEISDGGMRDALSILDQAIAYGGNNLKAQHVRDIYGIISNQEKIELVQLIINGHIKEIISKIDVYENRGVDFNRLTINLIDLFKSVIIYQNSPNYTSIKSLNKEQLNDLSNQLSNKAVFSIIDILVETLNNFKKVNTTKSFFELSCLKMAKISMEKEIVSNHFSIKKEEINSENNLAVQIEKKESSTNVEQKEDIVISPLQVNEEERVNPSKDDLLNILVQANKDSLSIAKQRWVVMSTFMKSPATAKVASMLLDGNPVAAANDALIIEYQNEIYLRNVTTKESFLSINNFLKALYNKNVVCYCITKEQFQSLKDEYKKLKETNNLPTARPILGKAVSDNGSSDPIVDFGRKLFGNKLQIKEE